MTRCLASVLFVLLATTSTMAQPRPPAPPELTAIKTAIRVGDFAASKRFYRGLLGLRVVEEWDDEGDQGCVFALAEESWNGFLEIAATSQNPAHRPLHDQRATDKVELQLETRNLDDWAERFEAAGLEFEGPEPRPWGNRYLWVRDPDGVRIALFEKLEATD